MDTEAEDTAADGINTPLTRADIPMIVNAVLSDITTDSTGAGGETEDTLDNAPLGSQLTVKCSIVVTHCSQHDCSRV